MRLIVGLSWFVMFSMLVVNPLRWEASELLDYSRDCGEPAPPPVKVGIAEEAVAYGFKELVLPAPHDTVCRRRDGAWHLERSAARAWELQARHPEHADYYKFARFIERLPALAEAFRQHGLTSESLPSLDWDTGQTEYPPALEEKLSRRQAQDVVLVGFVNDFGMMADALELAPAFGAEEVPAEAIRQAKSVVSDEELIQQFFPDLPAMYLSDHYRLIEVEPGHFLRDHLTSAGGVRRAWIVDCDLHVRLGEQRMVVPLSRVHRASIFVDPKHVLRLGIKDGAEEIEIRQGRKVTRRSRAAFEIGDPDLAKRLGVAMASQVNICNLYDCPDGRFCEQGAAPETTSQAEPPGPLTTPELTREESERAHERDHELYFALRDSGGFSEEAKGTIRALPGMSEREVDAVRERHGLAHITGMSKDVWRFHRALTGAHLGEERPIRTFLSRGGDVDRRASRDEYSSKGATLLGNAVRGRHKPLVELLLRAGAGPDVLMDRDRRPIELAAREQEQLGILKLLLAAGADPNPVGDGASPLWNAAASGILRAIELLLAHGADPNAWGTYDEPPLARAALNGHVEVAQALLNSGAAVDGRDDEGGTPLMFAVTDGSLDMIELLVERGADVNLANADGETALTRARESRKLKIAQFLESRGGVAPEDAVRLAWERSRPEARVKSTTRRRGLVGLCRDHGPPFDSKALAGDPELRLLLRDLVDRLGGAGDDSRDSVEILGSAWDFFDFEALLPLVLQTGLAGPAMDQAFADASTPEVLRGFFVNAGTILESEERVALLSASQFFETNMLLVFGLLVEHSQVRTADPEKSRESFDLLSQASELLASSLPCSALSAEDRMFAKLLSPLLQSFSAPLRPSAEPTFDRPRAADFARLRMWLDPWLRQLDIHPALYEPLGGSLPGHMGEAPFLELGLPNAKLPFLVLYSRPDERDERPFSCTTHERSLSNAVARALPEDAEACSPTVVEVCFLLLLMGDAGETGDPLDEHRTYEALFLMGFLARHYGDFLDRAEPGLMTAIRQYSQDLIEAIDLIDRPDEELSPLEVLTKKAHLTKYKNPVRARQLYTLMSEVVDP
ncbi:MAG: ankyrin repeat domain-containing protein [Acidobacteriota bacterium]